MVESAAAVCAEGEQAENRPRLKMTLRSKPTEPTNKRASKETLECPTPKAHAKKVPLLLLPGCSHLH